MFSSQYTYISDGKLLQEPNKKLIHMYLCHDSFFFLSQLPLMILETIKYELKFC